MMKIQGHIGYGQSFGMPFSRKLIETRLPDFYVISGFDSCSTLRQVVGRIYLPGYAS